jgi:hypothetical protein
LTVLEEIHENLGFGDSTEEKRGFERRYLQVLPHFQV